MKQIKVDKKTMSENMDRIIAIIDKMENKDVKNGLLELLDKVGGRYFTNPASARVAYHNCCVGGLADHSLRVYDNLKYLRDNFAPQISDDSIAIMALFHDLGKVGTLEENYFIQNDSTWHVEKLGELYKHNEGLGYLGTAQRSLRLLTQFNVELSEDEYRAIIIHDGQYIPENKSYAHKEGWHGLLLHQADMIACKMEHEMWENA